MESCAGKEEDGNHPDAGEGSEGDAGEGAWRFLPDQYESDALRCPFWNPADEQSIIGKGYLGRIGECGKGMNEARQRSRRFGRTTGTRARSAADYSITATISVVPDPLKLRKPALVFDTRNCLDSAALRKLGFKVLNIGK